MSTRAAIGFARPGGAGIDWIYCHWDGGPDYTGRMLATHYTTPKKRAELLALGDLSMIGPELGERHDFDTHTRTHFDWCLAYGRDRGDVLERSRFAFSKRALIDQAYDCWIEWVYVCTMRGRWECCPVPTLRTDPPVWRALAAYLGERKP